MELEKVCAGDCLNDVYCGGIIPKHLPLNCIFRRI
jgi:hypothetical protein